MNRETELLYLRDVRDLELARDRLQSLIYCAQREIEKKKNDVESVHYLNQYQDKSGHLIIAIVSMVSFVILYCMGEYWYESSAILLSIPMIVAILIFNMWVYEDDLYVRLMIIAHAIVSAIYTMVFLKNSKVLNIFDGLFSPSRGGEPAGLHFIWLIMALIITFVLFFVIPCMRDNARNIKINEENDQRYKEALRLRKIADDTDANYTEEINYYRNELKTVEDLLASEYSLNLIPTQYRGNLSAIWYIYDWMNSSGSSLRDALFSVKVEEGIQRLESKIGTIIRQNETIIFNQRMAEGNRRQMINKLESIETNSYEAARYAQIAANYSAAGAFFSAANYFKR